MKPVYLKQSLKLPISSTLISFFLAIILVACDTNTINLFPPAKPHASVSATKTMESHISPLSRSNDVSILNTANGTEDAGNLRIQSIEGFQCPYLFYQNGGLIMDQLVLASDRMTYSQEEIKQIRAYVTENADFLASRTEPPPTLRWVSGGSVDPVPGTWPTEKAPCGATLKLANTGGTPIQIPQVNVHLQQRPQANSYSYRLIDVCTVKPQSQQQDPGVCGPSIGHGGACEVFFASMQLGIGEKGSVFSAVPSQEGCNTLTIEPGAQVLLVFNFSLAPNTPKNLIYSIIPELIVDTAHGRQLISLSRFASTLAFADANQFSCYGLQGTTFVLEQSPVHSAHLWCL